MWRRMRRSLAGRVPLRPLREQLCAGTGVSARCLCLPRLARHQVWRRMREPRQRPKQLWGMRKRMLYAAAGSRFLDASSSDLLVGGNGSIEPGPGSYYCAAGGCGLACPLSNCCPRGLSVCARHSCVELTTDDLNCGACGVACTGGGHCSAGKCACPRGLAYCDGACIDVQASVANCGACGATCPVGATCVGGTCVRSCPAGQVQCGTNCVDLSSTKDHCGFCDQVCNGTLICAEGQCGCPPGLSDCAGYCVDLTSDPNNCGSCGMKCSAGGVCGGGACL